MADDSLSLLLKIRGDAASGKAAVAETRAAIASLRATTATEFGHIENAGSQAFASLADNVKVFVGQRIPLIGGAFVRVTENLGKVGAESQRVEGELAKFNKTVDSIATSTGKSANEIRTFLTSFVQLEGQAARDTAAIEKFGAATAQNLIPQLEGAATQLGTLATVAPEASGGLAGVLAAMGPVGIAAAGIAVELALVAIGIGAIAVVAKGLAEQFFELAKSAAEWRGALLDTSQQLGVSVETLSAFEILAKTTGGDLGSITASLGIFQKHLEAAQDPTSKEAKLLSDLGISANNTEDALRQTLTRLAAMPEGFHQTATALELFGRGGKSILAILKEMHGDLDGAIRRFREMGLIVSKEDAVAADKFNDELALLHFRFRALLGNEAIPAATKALEEFAKIIDDNRDVVDALGYVVHLAGLEIEGFTGGVIRPAIEALNIYLGPTRTLVGLYERMAAALKEVNANAIPAFTDFSAATSGASGGLDLAAALGLAKTTTSAATEAAQEAEKARKEAASRANKEAALSLSGLEEVTRAHLADLQRDRDRDLTNIDEWETESLNLAYEHRVGLETIYQQEAKNARKYIADKVDQFLALEEIEQKITKARNAEFEKRNEIQVKAQHDRDQAELNLNRQLAAIRDTAREGELARIKVALAQKAITESDAITAELALLKDAEDQRLVLIDLELNQESTSAAKKLELDNLRIQSEQTYTDEKKRLTDERIDAANREFTATAPGSQGIGPVSSDDIARQAGAAADAIAGIPPRLIDTRDAFGELGKSISDVFGLGAEGAEVFGNVLAGAFSSLAQAVGDAVQAFVLFGNAGGGIKKFTATLIAEIARMAAVQAVWELAQGLAMLALNFFWPDPKLAASAAAHFHAAAVYGGLAVIAAGVGRAVAGNSFQQSEGGGASSANSSQGRNPSDAGSSSPSSQNTNRISYQIQPIVHVTVVGQATEGFRYMVEKASVESVRFNGPMRKIQNGEDV